MNNFIYGIIATALVFSSFMFMNSRMHGNFSGHRPCYEYNQNS